MPEQAIVINVTTLQKTLDLLGLKLLDTEFNELQSGKSISLASKGLSEIGSLFILAAAISTLHSGNLKKIVAFEDLRKTLTESAPCLGIPVYCWDSGTAAKCCLYLNLVNGVLAVRIGCELK